MFENGKGVRNDAMILMELTEARKEGHGFSAGLGVPAMNESPASGAYGEEIAKYFRTGKATSLLIGCANSQVAITRLTSAAGLPFRTTSIPCDSTFVVAVHLTEGDPRGCEIWLGDRYLRVKWPIGGIGIYDLELRLSLRNRSPVDWVHYHFPRSVLETLADDLEIPRVRTLQCSFGTSDPVLYRMTEMILPSLEGSARFSELFLDHYCLLLCTHVMKTYGALSDPKRAYRGGLAPWQKRRVMELLTEHLDGSVRLGSLAGECGLSVSHFARSFRRTFGRSAHQFLILKRIEKAKALLSASMCVLSEAALQSGFSDQAAFSRTFKAVVGTSPGQWRREVCHRGHALYRRAGKNVSFSERTRRGS